MKTQKLMLFVYDFPHKKTQDFIFRLVVEGYKIDYCIAAPWKKLNIQSSSVRVDQKHVGLIHPRLICQKFKIKYQVFDHNSEKAISFIKKNPVDLYIVAGARILSKAIIQSCQGKVLNIHPGTLPDVRGLDTFLWSIIYNKALGITAHFITSKIDSGFLIYKEKLKLYKADTPFDITLRLLEYQSDILIKSLKVLEKIDLKDLQDLSQSKSQYNTKMNNSYERKTMKQFQSWLAKFANE